MKELVTDEPHPFQRHLAVRRQIDLVLSQRERLCQQVANTYLVVDDEHPWRSARAGTRGGARGGRRGWDRVGALPFEPGVDVGLAETPLPAHPDRRDLPRFDESIDGPQIDLQILENLVGCKKRFVYHDSGNARTARVPFFPEASHFSVWVGREVFFEDHFARFGV